MAIEEISPNMNTVMLMFRILNVEVDFKTFGNPFYRNQWKFPWFANLFYKQKEAEQILEKLQIILHNTLEIQHPQDDSVIRFFQTSAENCFFVVPEVLLPNYFFAEELSELEEKRKLCVLGGDLKNTFAVVPNNHVYISEYIGDLANFETYERFENTVKSYQKY